MKRRSWSMLVAAVGVCASTVRGAPTASVLLIQAPPVSSASGDSRMQALLSKARHAIGGVDALSEVTALVLVRQDGVTERILFPDRWQSIIRTPWGDATTTLDRDRWWSRLPKLPGALSSLSSGANTRRSDAVRTYRRQIAWYSLRYVLRPPSGYAMDARYLGRMTLGPLTGEAVEFVARDGYWVLMFFDPSTALPIGQARKMEGTPEINGTHFIEELRDYQPVGRIRVPLQVPSYRIRLGKVESLALWRFTVQVNPALSELDFREPPRKGRTD